VSFTASLIRVAGGVLSDQLRDVVEQEGEIRQGLTQGLIVLCQARGAGPQIVRRYHQGHVRAGGLRVLRQGNGFICADGARAGKHQPLPGHLLHHHSDSPAPLLAGQQGKIPRRSVHQKPVHLRHKTPYQSA